jgi:hypothetical protein
MIGVPKYDDVIRATATGMINSLEVVKDEVLPMFEEAAKKLLDLQKGDAIAAISKTLAYISGYHSKGTK